MNCTIGLPSAILDETEVKKEVLAPGGAAFWFVSGIPKPLFWMPLVKGRLGGEMNCTVGLPSAILDETEVKKEVLAPGGAAFWFVFGIPKPLFWMPLVKGRLGGDELYSRIAFGDPR